MAKKSSSKRPSSGIHRWIDQRPDQAPKRRRLLGEMHQLLQKPHRDDLLWWYKLGQKIIRFIPREDRAYGSSIRQLLADDLDPGRDKGDTSLINDLYFARRLADTFSKDEVARFAAAGLSRLQVASLSSLSKPEDRERFLRKSQAEGWSGGRLRLEVQNFLGGKKHSAGRHPNPPETMSARVALRDIFLKSRQWKKRHEVWFAGKKAALRRIPRKVWSWELLEELAQVAEDLAEVRNSIEVALDQLESLADEIEGALDSETGGKKR